jgi:hypothetical protein
MRMLHIIRSGSKYTIGNLHYADVADLVVYLIIRGVSQEHILDTIEILARDGACTVEQE